MLEQLTGTTIVHETLPFAMDIVEIIWARLRNQAESLHHFLEGDVSYENWLKAEAYLACRERQAQKLFCEVAHQPTYGSEGVLCSSGLPSEDCGAIRIGGSGGPGHHQWFFAEVVVLSGGRNGFDEGRTKTEHAILRLLKLGWKRSASVLVIVAGSLKDELGEWSKNMEQLPAWNRPLLLPPLMLNLPNGGMLAAKAFDIKRNPDDTLISVI